MSPILNARRAILLTLVAGLLGLSVGCASHVTHVRTDPPGATVTKDGNIIGVTPIDVPIRAGAIDGEETITVTKDDANRTVTFDNDQIMWTNMLISSIGFGGLALAMVGAGVGIAFLNPASGLLVGSVALLIAAGPVLTFLLSAWRMPEQVTISLKNDDVTTVPQGDYEMVVSVGSASDDESAEVDTDAPVSKPPPRDSTPQQGTTNGACYGNATCNDGLVCTDGKCRAAPTGSLGGACYGNHTCDDAMVCDAGTCIPAEE